MTVGPGSTALPATVPVEPGADWFDSYALVASTPATTVGVRLASGRGVLVGWSWIETTGTAAATLDLFDGLDANGSLVCPFALNPGESTRDFFMREGIVIRRGLFANVLTGSIRGACYFKPRGMP